MQDQVRVMQMTQGFLKRNLMDIFKKRQWEQSHPGKSELDQYRESHNIGNVSVNNKDWDPDANLPYYLRDRTSELYNPMKDAKITFTELRTIEKMKKLGKFDPLRDMNPPTEEGGEWTLKKVDSLVESVYNSEKNL